MRELETLRVDHRRGEQDRSPAMGRTVAELGADWLAHLESRIGDRDPRRRYSARTVAVYRQQFATHLAPDLGPRLVPDLTVTDIRRLVDRLSARGLAPASITSILRVLSGLLRFAVRNGHAERNVVKDLDRDDRPGAARQTEPRYLTAAELEALIGGLTDTFRGPVAACTYGALRITKR